MQHPDGLTVQSLKIVSPQALMEPDGLEQALDRQVVFVAQGTHGPRTRTPGGIKISGRRKHLEIALAPVIAQSQVNAQKIERILCRI
jgi:hypothetical protein